MFEDLTAQKQLDEERHRGDRLDFLNRVIGHIVHEIKNHLVSIKTFVELLDDRYDDPEFRYHFSNVMKYDVRALNSVTEKLIDFSSKISYRFEYGNINTAIKNCVSTLISNSQYSVRSGSEDYNGKKVFRPDVSNIHLRCEESLPLAEFDHEQFKKALTYILLYLINNINRTGSIAVSSNIGQSECRDKSICITVSGMGCTLSDIELQQLFDPFNIEQSNLVSVGPCIAQKIIEDHGGHLDIRQEKDGNATFVILLPVSR